jgi:hypothetical protein
MNREVLIDRLRSLISEPIPLPGGGETARRHEILMSVGREDLSLARLAEAHWDAVAILAEAGRDPEPGAIYGVWAAEVPGEPLLLGTYQENLTITGQKTFCSGAGLIDRALITVGATDRRLVNLDLRDAGATIQFDNSGWKTTAFAETRTSTTTFSSARCFEGDIIGGPGWYLERPGFWNGACGPAACWAGGAEGIVDYANKQRRADAHTLAHLGAMRASIWALRSFLVTAANEIDRDPSSIINARVRARTVRHLIEQGCTDILRRLARAYGPHPMSAEEEIGRRYQELDLYLRQSHAERDLEALGRDIKAGF